LINKLLVVQTCGTTSAEGVETEEQAKFLTESKCNYLQGYYFAKPVSIEDLKVILDRLYFINT
ncbi:EAL domain-containing protein, partial [Acinetobacter bereziniae]|uniref:EAL domain-containing protein n=1 Tax=Acinetobacter bereziniae TaxID=106648 RepID=UPI0018FF3078